MIKLNILELLKKTGRSKYWLREQMNISSGRDFNNLINGKTTTISFKTIDKLCNLLECNPGDLIIKTTDENIKTPL